VHVDPDSTIGKGPDIHHCTPADSHMAFA
jgi:hypothetical protein